MNNFNSYSGDPRQITARFASKCHTCGKPIKKGEQIIYWPNGKRAGLRETAVAFFMLVNRYSH